MSTQSLPLIKLSNVIIDNDFQFGSPINLELLPKENWIIYGPNGCGKTCLVNTLRSTYRLKQGKISYNYGDSDIASNYNKIKYVTFLDQYSSNIASLPYQMRWNHGTIDMTFEPIIKDYIKGIKALPSAFKEEIFKTIDFENISSQSIRSLSSGEFRRFQILQIITKHPKIIIIDNPFIGLDTEGRDAVLNLLNLATTLLNTNIIIVTSKYPQKLTGFTHCITIDKNGVKKIPIKDYKPYIKTGDINIGNSPNKKEFNDGRKIVVQANHINIKYGERTILKDLSLTIKQGEHWAITGQNGSGKSTLLSLICADNPQAYACDISLFGNKRGSGESIWEIKKHIGFVSPEMFKSFRKNLKTIDIVASGLYDTTGLFVHAKDGDYERARKWLKIFNLTEYEGKNYLTLSSGQQRLVLLCRAFIKEPSLLILDEPFHGLDDMNVINSKKIITNYLCADITRTMIMVSHYDTEFPQLIDHTLHLTKTNY